MINWWEVLTTVAGIGIAGIGGLLVSKINAVLGHVETFSKHIVECEMRNRAHAKIHDIQERETNRRLRALESKGHRHGEQEED